jgi:hypothetical protein
MDLENFFLTEIYYFGSCQNATWEVFHATPGSLLILETPIQGFLPLTFSFNIPCDLFLLQIKVFS